MVAYYYTPSIEVEASNFEAIGDLSLCGDTHDVSLLVSTDNEESMLLAVGPDTIVTALPFLLPVDEDGTREVRPVFSRGLLGRLYNIMQRAAEDGYMSADMFKGFQDRISEICDTLCIEGLCAPDITTTWVGNAIMSYDYEQNSHYAKFELTETSYSRRSSLSSTLQYISPVIEQLNAKGMLEPELVAGLESLINALGNVIITDGSGYCIVSLNNYYLSCQLHIEQATGLLDQLSKALYGTDTSGKANEEVWMVFYYEGGYDVAKNKEIFGDLDL